MAYLAGIKEPPFSEQQQARSEAIWRGMQQLAESLNRNALPPPVWLHGQTFGDDGLPKRAD